MEKPISFAELDFKTVASMDETRSKPEQKTPFRICIMGNFSGHANRGTADSSSSQGNLRPIAVDRDNIDDVMEKLGVEVQLSVSGDGISPITVRFTELDDFHPEQLYSRLEVFQTLRDTRKRLTDPRSFESARKKIRSWLGADGMPQHTKPGADQSVPSPAAPEKTSGSLLDQIVGEAEDRPLYTESVSAPSQWDSFMQRIVGPHLVPGRDPEQAELVTAVDAAISGLMKAILHHPDFKALESAWRALRFLLYRMETDALLKVYLIDISKDELAANLSGSDDLQKTWAYRLFVEQAVGTQGGEPWAVLAGNYTFNKTRGDVETLGRMAIIAKLAGAPFINGVHDHILGCESLADTPDPDDWKRPVDPEDSRVWKILRSIPDASYLGLALPRFLLRLPYGKATDPVDYFDFEEMSDNPVHSEYLWGNPAFICALLLAQAFSHDGWDLRPGSIQNIQDLPLHIYQKQGASVTKPCAEVLLTERAMEKILTLGVMPLLSYKNQDTARLARFQSIGDPLTQLRGRWQNH
jgi:type VI secretion system protein ImpC